jgi:putative PIN family toxin of toxin-antitoxin system
MSKVGFRVILDTNTLFRGLAKSESASGRVLEVVAAHRVTLLTSRSVVAEYRTILMDPKIVGRYESLTPLIVEAAIRKLVYYAEHLEIVRSRFDFPRDPKDAKFLELAISAKATHLITFDSDLLSLPTSHSDAAKRLRQRNPQLRIRLPGEFLNELEAEGH